MALVKVVPSAGPSVSSAVSTVCADLDGTLIATDLLYENLLELIKQHPAKLFQVPFWGMRGRPYLKAKLAAAAPVNAARLPYRQEVVDKVVRLRAQGARTVLATASHQLHAANVAAHLGCFDEVLATADGINLKGAAKARALTEKFGDNFMYLGDSAADLPVWAAAREGIVVGPPQLAQRAAKVTQVREVIHVPHGGWHDDWKALRPHHWSKNVLLLLPLLLAHRFDAHSWLLTILGMLFFGFGASAIYVLNDLLDLPSDREHPWKRHRPFASGRLSIAQGLWMAPLLLVACIGGGGFVLGWHFALAAAIYCALSMAYSLVLKRKPLLDVFVLTSFYGLRIITGALITHTPLSHWFLVFSMFFFFSLALAKRYSELKHAVALVEKGNSGRGYRPEDSPLLAMMGVTSAFAAVIVFSFYSHSPEVIHLYPHPAGLLMIAPLLLYWLVRIWLKAGRGELKEDPVTLAMRDPVSYAVGAASVVCIFITFFWR